MGQASSLAGKELLPAGKAGFCGQKERLLAEKERRRAGRKPLLSGKARLLVMGPEPPLDKAEAGG